MERIEFFNLFNALNMTNDVFWDLPFESGLIVRKRTIYPAAFADYLGSMLNTKKTPMASPINDKCNAKRFTS